MSSAEIQPKPGRRREGRKRGGDAPQGIDQRAWKQPRRYFKPVDLISQDQLEAIHEASLKVLEDLGLEIVNDEACEILRSAGAIIDGHHVRIGREIVEQGLKTVPGQFTFHARNPDHSLIIGGDHVAFAPVGGPPNCSDMDRGRRPGSFEDAQNFIRLSQYFNAIHLAGGISVDALDIHASVRHLHVARAKAKLSDKPVFASSTGRKRLFDGIECARISRGIDYDQMEREPSVFTVINTNSPLKIDEFMAMGIIEMARLNQICCVTPFTLAGAMAPVTMAGALVQQNAEALVGMALGQLVRPGTPFIYGGFTSNVDMKSGAPAFGTPEYMKACIIGGQLTRLYNVPYRTSSTNAANTVDAQAGYETVFSFWGAIMGGGHLIMHSAGWMEGGLVAGYEKFALDVDLVQMVTEFLEPLEMSEDALGLDAIREVGPGGHFFGCQHTLARYSNAFYAPLISDWRNFEQWQAAGSPTAMQKANAIWKQALADFRDPAMDPAIAEELDAFVDRRIAEGGQPTDF
ncbi:MAG: trimethylamine methyltransferase family protein [Hyphomicrobiales bacterium]|nr:trimethylamine methyltransferase family protein [Hyphomicrobiales bacterium]